MPSATAAPATIGTEVGPPFDHRTIGNGAIRDQYDRLLRRGRAASETIGKAYGRASTAFALRFVHHGAFNASVGAVPGGYDVALHAPVPLLIRMLFERLLGDERVLPGLPVAEGSARSDPPLFGLDPSATDRQAARSIVLDGPRAHAARLLSDLVMSYVLFHELGHVVSGHVEAEVALHGAPALQELVTLRRARVDVGRRQAWEYDADAVASTLLIHTVDALVRDTELDPESATVFGHGARTREAVLALTAVSLFALFAYLRGAERQIDPTSTHPHPLTRAFYVKDMLFHAASARGAVDKGVFLALLDERLDEMFEALETLDLVSDAEMTEAYLESVESDLVRLRALQIAHRDECAPWSWITWDAPS